jgi:hypothetical protein
VCCVLCSIERFSGAPKGFEGERVRLKARTFARRMDMIRETRPIGEGRVSAATIPVLTRTSADDRVEAARIDGELRADSPEAALAAIQRREAEAVNLVADAQFPEVRAFKDPFMALVARVAHAAFIYTRGSDFDADDGAMTLDQRGRLLDHARGLLALALEVAK